MAGVKFAGEEAVERIAHYVNKKLNIASTMPSTPNDEDIILYVGENTESYIQGCIYEYDEINEKWNIINSVQTVELTTAEYESLPVSVQNNGTIYFLTDGESSDSSGSTNYYGTCIGQAANQIKAVTISQDQNFELKTGVLVFVKFDANNTYNATSSNPVKLNVNNTGAKQIYAINTSAPTGTYTTYFGRADYVNQYIYNGTYWVWNGSSSDNDGLNYQLRYADTIKAAAAVPASTICVGTSSGYKTATSGITFDISYPILYAASAVSSGSTGNNFFKLINNRSASSLKSGFSGVAYSLAYLVLSDITGNIATIDSTVYTISPNVEGKFYIPIGIFLNTSNLAIDLTMDSIYIYEDGELKLYGSGSGGHTIINEAGTSLAQEPNLQFKGADVLDDSTNNRTVVDMSYTEINYEDWLELTEQEKETGRWDVVGVPGADGTVSVELMTKLWENSDTTTTFAAQDITLSSDDYDMLMFVYCISTTSSITNAGFFIKGSGGTLLFLASAGSSASQGAQNWRRFVSRTSDTVMHIEDAIVAYTGSVETNNDRLIPYQIYGIKTSKTVEIKAIALEVSTSASKCMLSDGETSVEEAIEALNVWTTPVNCAIGDTTATIVDENILTTSIIEDYSQNSSGTRINVSEITVTIGQAVLHFNALEEATSFRLHVVNV